MTQAPIVKLIPRNVAALRPGQDAAAATALVAGNSVATRLESGVGNCFPGLEFDARNLERRFFPFLEIDIGQTAGGVEVMQIASVDLNAVAGATLSAADKQAYRTIAGDLDQGRSWSVDRITGHFGPLGQLTFRLSELDNRSSGAGRLPPDPWTAARLLTENSPVTLVLSRRAAAAALTLTGNRVRYLEDDGALARMFSPGELTQSLCSPWTHDFRDCTCYYWASNHPDIALPPLPTPAPADTDPRWNLATDWERADRSIETPPVETSAGDTIEIPHHTINRDWQRLNFVLERREQLVPYRPQAFNAQPLTDQDALIRELRYAAGVELAVMQEYLTAAWSLQKPNGQPALLRDDLRAAFAEILRVAIGEMRHLRAINDVLARFPTPAPFVPALAVASQIPLGQPGQFRAVAFRPATGAVLEEFAEIEAPSKSVDGVYARILATLEAGAGDEEQQQTIRTVMAEGEDHWQTFLFVSEWLGRHQESTYLRPALAPPSPGKPEHQLLQQRYQTLLGNLFAAYTMRIPAGASAINLARSSMLGADGIEGALDAVASQNLLVVFDPIADARFAAIDPP
jgi:hypothetical protein